MIETLQYLSQRGSVTLSRMTPAMGWRACLQLHEPLGVEPKLLSITSKAFNDPADAVAYCKLKLDEWEQDNGKY